MCGPIRSLTEAKGHDVAKHHLASFGGAGGQHASAIAEALGIKKVLIHKYSSILSAYGIGLADLVHEEERVCAKAFDQTTSQKIYDDIELLADVVRGNESMQPFKNVQVRRFLNMRYDGSETAIMVSLGTSEVDDPRGDFIKAHHQQFGFTPTNRAVYVDTIRARAIGSSVFSEPSAAPLNPHPKLASRSVAPVPESWTSTYFNSMGWVNTPVYHFDNLKDGHQISGPAIVIDKTQTIVVSPNSKARLTQDVLVLDVGSSGPQVASTDVIDPVQLSIFRHRFMGVAEQMGRVLQNVSISANIKERLDFTCAIFTPEGDLVANAPHVPAMIGSMAFAVRSQIAEWQGKLQDGDVLLSNTPGKYLESTFKVFSAADTL
jgi:5-oxoprolinase (ATP-hydrolysing)